MNSTTKLQPSASPSLSLTALAALGVVFGDIGTSPIYAFKQCLSAGASGEDVFGIVSLIIWSLVILISIKYVTLVLRVDNQGEGGILALLSVVFPEGRQKESPRMAAIMTAVGLLGAALLYGDGVITPAISVLSSVEGLEVYSPQLSPWLVPLTVVILAILFAVQRKGSGSVGKVFGSIMLVWFLCLAIFGAVHLAQHPAILQALNPWIGLRYLSQHGKATFVVLGSVFLSVTGGEALYADLGHFGRRPIKLAWHFLVLPALCLNYLGQGALILTTPAAVRNPFFLLFHGPALLPMVLLGMAATIIASQALISGIFSLTMQAGRMGYLPRLRILHTNAAMEGQIYIPPVNAVLAAACIGIVLGFRSSARLGAAYGVAVTLTMLTTTVLFFFACTKLRRWPLWQAGLVCGIFAAIESIFFAANALKILHGGWLPLCIGGLLFYLMTTWKMGRQIILGEMEHATPLGEFLESLSNNRSEHRILPERCPGTAVYLTSSRWLVPGALVQNLKHNHVLHERNIVLTIVTDNVPRCRGESRLEIETLPMDFYHLIVHYGYMELPTMKRIIRSAAARDFDLDLKTTSFFLGGQRVVPKKGSGLPAWREAAFIFMSRNGQRAATSLGMPSDRTVEILWEAEV